MCSLGTKSTFKIRSVRILPRFRGKMGKLGGNTSTKLGQIILGIPQDKYNLADFNLFCDRKSKFRTLQKK
jgi:hypothetical protein